MNDWRTKKVGPFAVSYRRREKLLLADELAEQERLVKEIGAELRKFPLFRLTRWLLRAR